MSFKVLSRLSLFAADMMDLGYYAEDEEVREKIIDKLERIFPFDNIITDIDTAENYYEETREYPERETHFEMYEEKGEKYLREVYEDGTEVEFNTMCTLNLRLYGVRRKGADNNDFLLLKIERHYI